ncbi:hypothetical protein [Bdellovibrio sp. HCB-162]|uniref:hypothetical protein n=1 Tax=Bdellovibrio sp. HCB-162 TaxID=3394234 RepID=UPI0039BD2E4F
MNRRNFLGTSVKILALSFGAAILDACGGSSKSINNSSDPEETNPPGKTPTKPGASCLKSGTVVDIQQVHATNHTLVIPIRDINAGMDKIYVLEDNGSGHTHTVVMTAGDFKRLRNNEGAMEFSSFDGDHSHTVTVTCI